MKHCLHWLHIEKSSCGKISHVHRGDEECKAQWLKLTMETRLDMYICYTSIVSLFFSCPGPV